MTNQSNNDKHITQACKHMQIKEKRYSLLYIYAGNPFQRENIQ